MEPTKTCRSYYLSIASGFGKDNRGITGMDRMDVVLVLSRAPFVFTSLSFFYFSSIFLLLFFFSFRDSFTLSYADSVHSVYIHQYSWCYYFSDIDFCHGRLRLFRYLAISGKWLSADFVMAARSSIHDAIFGGWMVLDPSFPWYSVRFFCGYMVFDGV